MGRYAFYVDGFNVFHAIRETRPEFLWLDYGKMARLLVGPRDTVEQVLYFSAYASWKPSDMATHKEYVKALRASGVEAVMGRFMRKEVECHLCHRRYWTHEEKRTDVNIALHLVRGAVLDLYDRALIVSADSDLLPAIEAVHELAPDKEIGVMVPIGRTSVELKAKADFVRRMKVRLLYESQFPQEAPVGSEIIRRPAHWPPLPARPGNPGK